MELEIRVARLERESRRIKRLGLTTLVVTGLIMTLGQARPPQPDVIRASKFVLVDENGQQRATLGMVNGNWAQTLRELIERAA